MEYRDKSIVAEKSKAFALKGIDLYKYLQTQKREYTLSNQVLRSSTSIGANIAEGKRAQSHADFISKHSIALKEASETEYWLELLFKADYMDEQYYQSLNEDCQELIRLLMAITKHREKA